MFSQMNLNQVFTSARVMKPVKLVIIISLEMEVLIFLIVN